MEVSIIPPLIPTKYKYHGVVSFVHRDQFYGFVEVDNPGSINNSNSPTVLHFRPFLVMRSEERRYLRVGTNVLFNEITNGTPNNTIAGFLTIFDSTIKKIIHPIDDDDSFMSYSSQPQKKRLRRNIDGVIEDEEDVSPQGNDYADEVVTTQGHRRWPTLSEGFINDMDCSSSRYNPLHNFLIRRFGYARDGTIVRARHVVGIEEAFDLYRIPIQLMILKEFWESMKFQPEDFEMLKKNLEEVCENVSPDHLANARRDVDVQGSFNIGDLFEAQRIVWRNITSHVDKVCGFQRKCFARRLRDFFRKHLDVERWFLHYGRIREQRWYQKQCAIFGSDDEIWAGVAIATWLDRIGLRRREERARRHHAGTILSNWLKLNIRWWMAFFAAENSRRHRELAPNLEATSDDDSLFSHHEDDEDDVHGIVIPDYNKPYH